MMSLLKGPGGTTIQRVTVDTAGHLFWDDLSCSLLAMCLFWIFLRIEEVESRSHWKLEPVDTRIEQPQQNKTAKMVCITPNPIPEASKHFEHLEPEHLQAHDCNTSTSFRYRDCRLSFFFFLSFFFVSLSLSLSLSWRFGDPHCRAQQTPPTTLHAALLSPSLSNSRTPGRIRFCLLHRLGMGLPLRCMNALSIHFGIHKFQTDGLGVHQSLAAGEPASSVVAACEVRAPVARALQNLRRGNLAECQTDRILVMGLYFLSRVSAFFGFFCISS